MASANISSGVAARSTTSQHTPPASPLVAVTGASPRNSMEKSNVRTRSVGARGASHCRASTTPAHRTAPLWTDAASSARGACSHHRTSTLVALRGNAAGTPRTRCRAATISSPIVSTPAAQWHGSGSIVLSTARCTGSGPFSLAKISAEVAVFRDSTRAAAFRTGVPLVVPPPGRQAGRSLAPALLGADLGRDPTQWRLCRTASASASAWRLVVSSS